MHWLFSILKSNVQCQRFDINIPWIQRRLFRYFIIKDVIFSALYLRIFGPQNSLILQWNIDKINVLINCAWRELDVYQGKFACHSLNIWRRFEKILEHRAALVFNCVWEMFSLCLGWLVAQSSNTDPVRFNRVDIRNWKFDIIFHE